MSEQDTNLRATVELVGESIPTLQESLSNAQDSISGLQEDLGELDEEVAAGKALIDSLRERAKEISSVIDQMMANVNTLAEAIEDCRGDIVAARGE